MTGRNAAFHRLDIVVMSFGDKESDEQRKKRRAIWPKFRQHGKRR